MTTSPTVERKPLTLETLDDMSWDEYAPLISLVRPKNSNRPVIHHYTSVDGLIGMIDSNAIHASNAFFLNDSSEMNHGLEMVITRLEARLPTLKDRNPAQTILISLIERLVAQSEVVADAYVACFCKKGDLLSQWRAYGDVETSYSVGFSVRRLWGRTTPDTFIAPVTYLPHKKMQRIDTFIDGAIATLDHFTISDLDYEVDLLTELSVYFSYPLLFTAMFMKHEAFKEENEWRLVYVPWFLQPGDQRTTIEAKTRNGVVLPYVSVGVRTAKGVPAPLPVTQVRVGPTRDPVLAARGVRQLLRIKNMPGVSVTNSLTPLR